MAKNDPLRTYLEVQTKYDRELDLILERAARDVREQALRLAGKGGIGAEIRTAQLAMVSGAITRRQHALWVNQVRPTIVTGRVDAAKAAHGASETMERTILSALPGSRGQILTRGLGAAAAAGIETDYHRVSRELSTRIYKNRDLATRQVEKTIRSAIIRGLSAREMANDVYRHVSPTARGGAAAAAKRLARTEINNAFHQQQIDEANKPWVKAAKWNLSGSHPKPDECNVFAARNASKLGAGLYLPTEIPGKPHPNCLCFLTYETDDELEFLDNFFEGKYDKKVKSKGIHGHKHDPVIDLAPPDGSKISHAGHAHPATPAGRAACRASIAAGNGPIGAVSAAMPKPIRQVVTGQVKPTLKEAKEILKPPPAKVITTPSDRPRITEQPLKTSTNSAKVREVYGDKLHIHDDGSEFVEKHLKDLNLISKDTHQIVADHMGKKSTGGIYIGEKPITDLGAKGVKRGDQYSVGRKAENVNGCYHRTTRELLIGKAENGAGTGCSSLANHEFGHALMDAIPFQQRRPLEDVIRKMHSETAGEVRAKPYYSPKGNPLAFESESLAEAFSAWTKTGTLEGIMDALGINLGRAQAEPYILKLAKGFSRYHPGEIPKAPRVAKKVPDKVVAPKRLTDKELMDHVVKNAEDFAKYDPRYPDAVDQMLTRIIRKRGFDAKPAVVDAKELNAQVRKSGIELHRGVKGNSGPRGTVTADDILDQLKGKGEWHSGTGIYGNGTYFSVNKAVAQQFAGSATKGLTRATINPNAKIISYSDLSKEHEAFMRQWYKDNGPVLYPGRNDVKKRTAEWRRVDAFEKVVSDPGRFAALRGYDAMKIVGEHDGLGYSDQYVVFNRAIMTFEKGK